MWHLPCLLQINSSDFCTFATYFFAKSKFVQIHFFPPINKIRSTFDACFLVKFFVSGDSETCNKIHAGKDHRDLRKVSDEKTQSP